MDTKQLEQKIISLEKQLKDLQTSSLIPINLIRSLEGAGFIKTAKPEVPPYGDWQTNEGFTYEPGGGIFVQSAARTYLKINDGNRDLFIPLLQYIETP